MAYTARPDTVRRFTWPWLVLALLAVAFLAFSVPPYLTFDPARSRLPIPADVAWYYPALVVHILLGAVALVAACVQLWPWLRATHPEVHRRSGRVYAASAILASLSVLTITMYGVWGANQRVANTMLALLWLITTVAGVRAARRRRFAEHREWMVRSAALAFSIVANRIWVVLCIAVFAPEVFGTDPGPAAAPELAQAVGASAWLSWVVNLLVAEWWLHRTRHRACAVRFPG
ncbi:DUF2306 domain-containing protein [Pseudonocardia sp.]|uniref:DUF2306 domain-containing protein n=1 Tax=Pseudonocardia sp. TaxID=60912 RepID=UPI003D0BBB09